MKGINVKTPSKRGPKNGSNAVPIVNDEMTPETRAWWELEAAKQQNYALLEVLTHRFNDQINEDSAPERDHADEVAVGIINLTRETQKRLHNAFNAYFDIRLKERAGIKTSNRN